MFKEILYSNFPIRYKKLKRFFNVTFPLSWIIFELGIFLLCVFFLYGFKSLEDFFSTLLFSYISFIPVLLFCLFLGILTYFEFQITKNEKKYQKAFYTKYVANLPNSTTYCRICGQELSATMFKFSRNSYIKPVKIGGSDYKNYYCKHCFKKFSLPIIKYSIVIALTSIIPVIIYFTFILKMENVSSTMGLINLLFGIPLSMFGAFYSIYNYIQGISTYN
jgi:hypothetical protein